VGQKGGDAGEELAAVRFKIGRKKKKRTLPHLTERTRAQMALEGPATKHFTNGYFLL
jgi:hypothetical protein